MEGESHRSTIQPKCKQNVILCNIVTYQVAGCIESILVWRTPPRMFIKGGLSCQNENFFCIILIFGMQSSPKNCFKNSTKILAFFMCFRIRALLLPCFVLPRWAGILRDVTRGTTVLLQYCRQWLRPGSKRMPGEGSTPSKVDFSCRSGCLTLQHLSPSFEKRV